MLRTLILPRHLVELQGMMPGRSRRKRKKMFPFIRILLMAAVIPALVLLKYVYDHDHLEKEPPAMLLKLIFLLQNILLQMLHVQEKPISLPMENQPQLVK